MKYKVFLKSTKLTDRGFLLNKEWDPLEKSLLDHIRPALLDPNEWSDFKFKINSIKKTVHITGRRRKKQ